MGWKNMRRKEVKDQPGCSVQTHRRLGQTQNVAILNIQTILQHTDKQKHIHGEGG